MERWSNRRTKKIETGLKRLRKVKKAEEEQKNLIILIFNDYTSIASEAR